MTKITVPSVLAIAISISVGLGMHIFASAQSLAVKTSSSPTLTSAYAPDHEKQLPFDQIIVEEELHELNDAWLGMPVQDDEGHIIGFVEDAWLDELGEVTEVLISLDDHSFGVFIDAKMATLSEQDVSIALPISQIVKLERIESLNLAKQ